MKIIGVCFCVFFGATVRRLMAVPPRPDAARSDAPVASDPIRPHELRAALEADQFDLLYQPVIALSTRRVGKAEALVRWRHPERGYLLPQSFIAQAESSGLIDQVGAWVLHRALRDLASLRARHPDFQMSVNVSPVQIDSGSLNRASLLQGLEAHGVAASGLIVEITEAVALQHAESTRERLASIRAAGVKLAIDDFGMGNSALTSLIHFPCDFIKLDREYVGATAEDHTRRAIARLIVEMAHVLDLQVIGEGVENEDNLAHVVALGCDHAQGYYWGTPLTIEGLRAVLDGAA